MKQTLSILFLVAATIAVISCNSDKPADSKNLRPVGSALGKDIISLCIELGKAENINCIDALKNKDITNEAVAIAGGTVESYAKWINSDSGKKILQDFTSKCMTN